jgi:hypothetical protein
MVDEVEGELMEVSRDQELAQKKAARIEQGMAKTYPELVALFKKQGSSNPHGRAKHVLRARGAM